MTNKSATNQSHARWRSVMRAATVATCFVAAAIVWLPPPASAQDSSALDLLGSFDRERLDSAYPIEGEETVGELAKLVYRLQKIAPATLVARASASPDMPDQQQEQLDAPEPVIGDAATFDGLVASVRRVAVPERLIEFLEIEGLLVLKLETEDGLIEIIAPTMVASIAQGDRIAGQGVVIEADASAIAAGRLQWFPARPTRVGWSLLGSRGVDISRLPELETRNRQPLVSADAETFYAMMAAAAQVGTTVDAELPQPLVAAPVQLLASPQEMTGQWIRMRLETVQITRIAVTQAARRKQLGQDHYFQIDAVADLGNVVIKVEPSGDDTSAPAATFENRYPVSVVTATLPDFLRQAVRQQGGDGAIVVEVTGTVDVDGFFYRLWSYQSEYMKQFGGRDQFGPLVVAARITDRQPVGTDPAGVAVIGWVAATLVFLGILGTLVWHRRTSRTDAAIRRQQKERDSASLDFPPLD